MKKLICLLLLAALLLAGCGSQPETPAETTDPPATGAYVFAPNFTVYDAAGKAVKLSDYLGQPVVLNFWASWCGPCKNEMPEFQKAFETYGSDIQFLMVDVGEEKQDGADFIASAGYTFPVFFDIQGEAANAYQVTAIPATYFIAADGQLLSNFVGTISAADLQAGIDSIRTP